MDFGYEIPGLARYRANYFMQKNGIGAVFREIPSQILTAEQLGLPPVMSKLASLPRGLVIVTGPTGSGKSTTLAAIIDVANRTRSDHIITIEDPIEFVHKSRGCLVNHREVGLHTRSFSAALRGALREDPDIILVVKCVTWRPSPWPSRRAPPAIWCSVPCTPPVPPKPSTGLSRCFRPGAGPDPLTLADGIRAIISQTLFKRIRSEGAGAGLEILIATPAVRNLIREAKSIKLPSMMQTGKKYGMQLLDDAIMTFTTRGGSPPTTPTPRPTTKAASGRCSNRRRPILPRPG